MIYPVLYLNDTEEINNIALIDTEFDDDPFLDLSFFREDCPEIFVMLLIGLLKQHTDGYIKGYNDGWEDCVEEYDIEEDEYGDINYK